ncbi:hypothetical protein D3C81_325070 [compost metagenome]
MRVVVFLRSRVAGLNTFEDLFAVHLNIFWRIDTNPHLHPFDAQNGDFDVIVDDDAFANLTGEYQHVILLGDVEIRRANCRGGGSLSLFLLIKDAFSG